MFQSRHLRIWMYVIGLGILLSSLGCGNRAGANRASISGEVTLDGQPLKEGSIRFEPMQGIKGTVTGADIKDGRYQIAAEKGPAVGMNIVQVNATRKSGRKVPKPFAPPTEKVDEMVSAVAPQYNSDSKLQYEVKPGENKDANFQVKSK
jgi:hypothetical protein